MLYIIEPRTESDRMEAVGLPGVKHHYGDNYVTYSNNNEEVTLSEGSLVNCNGTLSLVLKVIPMQFGRVILSVNPIDSTPRTTTGALMR